MADEVIELQLEQPENDWPTPTSAEVINRIIHAAMVGDTDTLATIHKEVGGDSYIQALRESYDTLIQDIYFHSMAVMAPKPITDPPNRLQELVDVLWHNRQPLTAEQQQLKLKVTEPLLVLQRLRQYEIDAAAYRRANSLQGFAMSYFSESTTYGEVATKRGLVKEMILTLPDLDQIKDQFMADAAAILGIDKDPNELEESYLMRIIELLYNYQLFAEIVGAVQDLTNATDDDTVQLQGVDDIGPDFIADIAKAQDEDLAILDEVDIPEELRARYAAVSTEAEPDTEAVGEPQDATELDQTTANLSETQVNSAVSSAAEDDVGVSSLLDIG